MILILDKSVEKEKKNLKEFTRIYFMCQSLSIVIFFLVFMLGGAHRSLTVGFLLLQHFSCFVLSSSQRCFISVIS